MPTLEVKVTRRYIKLASENYPACPLAMALFGAGLNRPTCNGKEIKLGGLSVKLPKKAREWYARFLKMERGEPFRFRVNVPKHALHTKPYGGGSAVLVKVGRRHIAVGKRDTCSSDPLALAMRERGFVRPSVGFYGIYARSPKDGREVAIRHSPESLAFVCETFMGWTLRPEKFVFVAPSNLIANGRSA